jgi:hypothetical protein
MKIIQRVIKCLAYVSVFLIHCDTVDAAAVDFQRQDDRVVVTLDGEPFAEYRFAERRPCFFPVLGPSGEHSTRRWPLDASAAANESQDHPHHTGLFYAHGAVRLEGEAESADFWHNERIELKEFVDFEANAKAARIVARHSWKCADGTELFHDEVSVGFGGDASMRWIDYSITLYAPEDKALILGDTKEGSFAIRVPEALTMQTHLKQLRHLSTGKIATSEGVTGRKAWGTRAKWCVFHGELASGPASIAIFDHPENPRHPTWWMARHYGLFAANATGQSYFEKKPKGSGDFKIPAGASATFRYRLNLSAHVYEQKAVEQLYGDWLSTRL